MMTPDEFNRYAVAVNGSAADLTGRIARLLKVNPRTVGRWRAGKARIPDGVERELRRLGAAEDVNDPGVRYRRDRWLVAFGPARNGDGERRYIVHRWRPRFIARIIDWWRGLPGPEAGEGEVDVSRGAVIRLGRPMVLAEVEWIDPMPDGTDADVLLQEAAEATAAFYMERDDLEFRPDPADPDTEEEDTGILDFGEVEDTAECEEDPG